MYRSCLCCAAAAFISLQAAVFPQTTASGRQSPRERFLSVARSYEEQKVPYRWGGMSRQGVDCSGLILAAARESLNMATPHSAKKLYAHCNPIENIERQPGDLVFFKTEGANQINHVGIYLENNRVLHAIEGSFSRVTISSLDKAYWKNAYTGAGRFLPETQAAGNTAVAVSAAGTAAIKTVQQQSAARSTAVSQTLIRPPEIPPATPKEKRELFLTAAHAAEQMHIPFVPQGTSRSGVDAAGLIYALARDVFGAADFPDSLSSLYSAASKITEQDAEPGDILFFSGSTVPDHAGIYLGNSMFIHACDGRGGTAKGVIRSSLKEPVWKKSYCGIARIFAPSAKPVPAMTPEQTAAAQKREKLTDACRKVIGTPYKKGGTAKDGVDDIGLIYAIGRDVFNTKLPATLQSLFDAARRVNPENAEPGDILFFEKDGRIIHAGVYIGDKQFIHAVPGNGTPGGVIESSINEPYWSNSFYCVKQIIDPVKKE